MQARPDIQRCSYFSYALVILLHILVWKSSFTFAAFHRTQLSSHSYLTYTWKLWARSSVSIGSKISILMILCYTSELCPGLIDSEWDNRLPGRVGVQFEDTPAFSAPAWETDGSHCQDKLDTFASCVPVVLVHRLGSITRSHSCLCHLLFGLL